MNFYINHPNLVYFAVSNTNIESKWKKIKKMDEFQAILGKTDISAFER